MMLLITIALALLAPAGAGGSVPAPALPRPVPIGVGPSFRPPAARGAALAGQPILGLACAAGRKATMAVHVEVFARDRVVPVPWGIGRHGDCRYPAWTDEPTGVVMVDGRAGAVTLGQLFAVWGQPLGRRRLCGFAAHRGVRLYVNGRRVHGRPAGVALRPHDEIVLAVGPPVPVHSAFLFPPGL